MAWYKNHLVQKLTHGSMEQNTELRSKPTYLAKSKGETERYIQLNTGFQRMAKRDKKGFFNEQCKETEENNRRGKTRVLLNKTIYIKGTFHPKMGTIKDSNGRDLEEAERSRRDRKDRGKDGGEIGRQDHFLPHKFLKRTFQRRANFTKQLL